MSRGRKSRRRREAQAGRSAAEKRAAGEKRPAAEQPPSDRDRTEKPPPDRDRTEAPPHRGERKSLPRRAAAALGRYDLVILLVVGIAVAIYFGLPDEQEDAPTAPSVDLPGQTTGPQKPPPRDRDERGAERASRSASPQETFGHECGTCHTLAAAGTEGITGPDLDEVQPSEEQVLRFIRTGSLDGVMPPNLVRGETAQKVAEFVARAAGQGG